MEALTTDEALVKNFKFSPTDVSILSSWYSEIQTQNEKNEQDTIFISKSSKSDSYNSACYNLNLSPTFSISPWHISTQLHLKFI